jgi:hypothetical protein
MSDSITFDRLLLAEIVKDVRERIPGIQTSEAWVYKTSLDEWEFHYRDYYWWGSASSAYEAKFQGWSAYLEKLAAQVQNTICNGVDVPCEGQEQ